MHARRAGVEIVDGDDTVVCRLIVGSKENESAQNLQYVFIVLLPFSFTESSLALLRFALS